MVEMNPFEAFGHWLGTIISWVLSVLEVIGPIWATLAAAIAIFLETTLFLGLVVPGDTIVVAAATTVRTPTEFIVLTIAVIAGTLGGQSVGFLLGRLVGPALRRSWLGRKLGERNWERATRYAARRGGIAVFVSRFLPVLHALMPVTVGMSPMRYRRFLAWAAPAAVIWAFAYVSVGVVAAESFRAMVDQLHYAGYIFAGAIVVFALIVLIVKRFVSRGEERHMAEDTMAADDQSAGADTTGTLDPDDNTR